ncbi:MAG: hypothetical protein N3E51_04655 [Candidatus Micrarchaeota archaeon]|nr:hypothetical protein [Candidatus Micrarchaeota archaeon]
MASALECQPGTSQCFNETAYQTCNPQSVWSNPVDCDAGMLCMDGACQEPVGCKPGTRKCASATSYKVCGDFAIWGPEQPCPEGTSCKNGQCISSPQCNQPGITRCAPDGSNTVQVCNANLQWETLKTCNYGCVNGYCRACSPGSTRCADGTHYQTCDSDGSWGTSYYCGKNRICDSGTCILNPAITCQEIGAYRCSPTDSSMLQRCGSNYQWADYQYCPLGCFYSACRACSTGQTKCKDAETYYMCNERGQWGLETSCPTGYVCFAGSCQVLPGSQCKNIGEKRCSPSDPNKLQICNSNYAFVDYLTCTKGCFDGLCAECTPGASMCSGANSYRTCTQNGQLSDEKACPQGTTCEDGACVQTHICTDGHRQCISGAVYSCEGGNWSLLYHCPQDNDCKEEQGTAFCVPEAKPASAPAPSPAPAPQPQKEESPLGSFGIVFVVATIALAGVAYYFYSKKR